MLADDRAVHAEGGHLQVVRYDRAGKWWIESTDPAQKRQPVTLAEAVGVARNLLRTGGIVHYGLKGGSTFDARMRKG